MSRKPYPTDVSDEEWSFPTPYLTLMDQHASQREHDLREVFSAGWGRKFIARSNNYFIFINSIFGVQV